MRYGRSAVKILVCCENEIVCDAVALSLSGAGHQAVASADPMQLASNLAGAGALVVDAVGGRRAIALLRDRGFAGRALVTGVGPMDDLAELARKCGADGALGLDPLEDLPARFTAALSVRRRVLIVDDNEIVARFLERELAGKGFEVLYAPDAEVATTLLARRETRPDLILLDVKMPRIDGPQFCRFVKRNERFQGIKVILCTGAARDTVEQLAAECGADGFLFKDEFLGKWVAEHAGG
jgi:CheY-like chemotaxis protein